MLEILVFAIVVVPALAIRARKRAVSPVPYVVAVIAGFVLFVFLGSFLGAIARWLWVGVVFLAVEFLANRGRKGKGTWQCPNCQMFNDLRTLRCLCGTNYEDATAGGST